MTRLGHAIIAYEQKFDLHAKDIANEIGIGSSTLTRIKQGHTTDAHNMLKVMEWLLTDRTPEAL